MDFSSVITSVSTQVSVMLALIILGYIIAKKKILTTNGSSEIGAILLNIVTPCVLIRAYHINFIKSEIINLLTASGISVVVHVIYILFARLFFLNVKDNQRRLISESASVYSNCGYMAIPLIEACFGSIGVFYSSAYLCIFTLFVWTHCKNRFNKSDSSFLKSTLLNPGIIGVVLGLLIYFTQIKLPTFAYKTISFVADLNSPLAMLLIGNFLARSGVVKAFKDKGVYVVSFFKLIIAPLILAGCLFLIKADITMSMCIIISAACPVAALIPIFAANYNNDHEYATNLTVASTLFSVITIPAICLIASMIFK